MSETTVTPEPGLLTFNPESPKFLGDPYAHYAELRERNPLHETDDGVLMCFSYADVRALLQERTISLNQANRLDGGAPTTLDDGGRNLGLLRRDPPDHGRIRRLMMKAFTPRKVFTLGEWIDVETSKLLDGIEERRQAGTHVIEAVDELAFPLPFRVISKLLGMPDGDDQQVRAWALDVASATDPTATADQRERAAQANKLMTAYILEEVLPWKRANPSDDLLSALMQALEDGDLVSEEELLAQIALLYTAGHETTVGLISNGLLTLLEHRDQRDRLVADPELIANTVEEVLRFETPVQFTWRVALEDIELRDRTLERGRIAFACLASANHDPAKFGVDASVFDITRAAASEAVAFGGGMHFCLGAPLARREAVSVIGQFVQRYPHAELAGPAERHDRVNFRSPLRLPIALDVR
ncbi:MAG: hypothetical protein QOH68_879 [Nocardioidaceae bacterium]|nr:hypothetical protein [Nocardioidaceae bacterium]